MNVQRIKPHLDKINSLYDYLLGNQATLSRLDQDAFLAAIRSLYEACIVEEAAPQQEAPVTTPPPVETPEPKVEDSKTTKKKRPKMVFTQPSKPKVTEQPPVVKEVPKEEPKKQPVEPPKPNPPVDEKPTPKPEPPATKEPTPPVQNTATATNEEYEELFAFKEATDLSQKLSASPIADLSKALGMNEKYLYINELFGGDVATFQTALKQLNNGESFDQARQYLEQECIGQHNWMDKNRKVIAKNFVKLVRRRYL